MTKLLLVCLFLSMSACSSQKPFLGVIFIRNPCNAPLSVSVSKFSGYISSLEGILMNILRLLLGNRKQLISFNAPVKNRI